MIGIIASRSDGASIGIAAELVAHVRDEPAPDELDDRYDLPGAELRVLDRLHIRLSEVEQYFAGDPDWIAVVSRHAGDTGPLLTAHFPGNVASAEFGGTPRELPPACPGALKAYYGAIIERAPDGYEVGLECTHHGPTECTVPLMFLEIGSDPPQWHDQTAAQAVADALWDARTASPHHEMQVAGVGGGHYVPRFERVLADTNWALGHVAPAWALDEIEDREALSDALERVMTSSQTDRVLVVGDQPAAREALAAMGYDVVSERWLRATSALSIPVVSWLESNIQPLDDGLALGKEQPTAPEELTTVRFTDDIMETAAGIDHPATIETIEASTVGYATASDGTRPTGLVALTDQSRRDGIVDGLLAILRQTFDSIDRQGAHLEVQRRRFDPARAKDKGVPEGPLFGRLADGESVTVDGREIDPAEVVRVETDTLALFEEV